MFLYIKLEKQEASNRKKRRKERYKLIKTTEEHNRQTKIHRILFLLNSKTCFSELVTLTKQLALKHVTKHVLKAILEKIDCI